MQQLTVILPDLLSTCRKRSLPRDDLQANEPPAKRGRRQRKGKTSKSKQNKAANEVKELPHMSQTALQVESPPSTPQTDQPSPAEVASEQRRKRKRWSNEAAMTPPILLDELPAPKRRRATYSISPPSHSLPATPQVSEVEIGSKITEEMLPISPPEHTVNSDLESSTRQRHSTYTVLENDSQNGASSPMKTSGGNSDSDLKEM